MNQTIRDLEFVLGVALLWGVLWIVLGLTVGSIIWVLDPDSIDPGEEPYFLALWIGLVGFILGSAFGGLLFLVERGRTLVELSSARAAMWGFLVSASLPLLTGKDLGMMVILGPLGALSAVTSIAIMRKWASRRTLTA